MSESKNEKLKEYLRELEILDNDFFHLNQKIRRLSDEMFKDGLIDESDVIYQITEQLNFAAEIIYEVKQSIKRKLEVK
jgi:tRNA A37 N6-isopentenylltransferase MiaA